MQRVKTLLGRGKKDKVKEKDKEVMSPPRLTSPSAGGALPPLPADLDTLFAAFMDEMAIPDHARSGCTPVLHPFGRRRALAPVRFFCFLEELLRVDFRTWLSCLLR